ncbi:MAG: hypothetical protein JWP44_5131 [Mucilaginibacter sp.]|nr:hypothetical protein [Mucilaginibacter sp.]
MLRVAGELEEILLSDTLPSGKLAKNLPEKNRFPAPGRPDKPERRLPCVCNPCAVLIKSVKPVTWLDLATGTTLLFRELKATLQELP